MAQSGHVASHGYIVGECTEVCTDCVGEADYQVGPDWQPTRITGSLDRPCACQRCGSLIRTALTTEGERFLREEMVPCTDAETEALLIETFDFLF